MPVWPIAVRVAALHESGCNPELLLAVQRGSSYPQHHGGKSRKRRGGSKGPLIAPIALTPLDRLVNECYGGQNLGLGSSQFRK
jgi:hypothetical protein